MYRDIKAAAEQARGRPYAPPGPPSPLAVHNFLPLSPCVSVHLGPFPQPPPSPNLPSQQWCSSEASRLPLDAAPPCLTPEPSTSCSPLKTPEALSPTSWAPLLCLLPPLPDSVPHGPMAVSWIQPAHTPMCPAPAPAAARSTNSSTTPAPYTTSNYQYSPIDHPLSRPLHDSNSTPGDVIPCSRRAHLEVGVVKLGGHQRLGAHVLRPVPRVHDVVVHL